MSSAKTREDRAALHAQRVRSNIERLRAQMQAKKTLPDADRPKFARNLGELIEVMAVPNRPSALTREIFDKAFAAGGEKKLSNRKRYVRFDGEALPLDRLAHGEYAAKVGDFWPIAQAIAEARGGGDDALWSVIGAMVKGTSFAVAAPTALALSVPSDTRALKDLDEIAARIAERTGLAAYFRTLSSGPFARLDPWWKREDLKSGEERQPRFGFGGHRIDFGRLAVAQDCLYEGSLIPSVCIGEVCIPFPVLSVDIPIPGFDRQHLTKDEVGKMYDTINQAICERFGRSEPLDHSENCGGKPSDGDPWSLQAYGWATKTWRSNDSSAFWGSSCVENHDGRGDTGRAWRRLYATFNVSLTMQPSDRGIVFGLNTSGYQGFDPNNIFSVVTDDDPVSAVENVATLDLFWRNGLFAWRMTDADCADVLAGWQLAMDGWCVPIGHKETSLLLFGPLSPLRDGGQPASWTTIATGPVGFLPNFSTYPDTWVPAAGDTLAGMLLQHFIYSQGEDGIEAQLTAAAVPLVQALNRCVEDGVSQYATAKARMIASKE